MTGFDGLNLKIPLSFWPIDIYEYFKFHAQLS